MRLGAMPGMTYIEKQDTLGPGDVIVLHSAGLADAHDAGRQMFGFPRMRKLIGELGSGHDLIDGLLESLHAFTGPSLEPGDAITLVTLAPSPHRRAAGHVLAHVD